MSDLSYEQWTERLGHFFFDPAHDGEEILFAVDDAALAEASGLEDSEAVASLALAVRSVIGSAWAVERVGSRVRRWQHDRDGDHPAIPFLALTVLAAFRMGEHARFAAHNYYVPLRRLIDPDDRDEGPPGSFTDHIGWLWRELSAWANVELNGRRGSIEVRDPGHHRYVGLALQHALFKMADLRHLDAFFRRIGLDPGDDVPAAQLRRALAVWTADRPESWAQRLHRLSTDADLAEHCEIVLQREARHWDGQERDPRTGRPIGHVRVGIETIRRPRVGLYVEYDERFPETVTIAGPDGEPLEMRRSGAWYEPHPMEDADVDEVLVEGLELAGERCRFSLRPDDVYALSYDDDLGAWTSTSSMSYGDRYHLLVHDEVVAEVVRFVRAESVIPSTADERSRRHLPRGWQLITDVRIDARPRTEIPRALAGLIPAGAGPTLRLLGGLPVGPRRAVYLRGGEPVLSLSSLSDDARFSIRRIGTGQVESLAVPTSGAREFPLWRLKLEPDSYEVWHGESRVRLQIIDGITELAGQGAGTISHTGRGSVSIVGTATSASPLKPPITVRAPHEGAPTKFLGSSPDQYQETELPLWFVEHVGTLSWDHIDAWVDFVPVWQLLDDGKSWRALLMTALEPSVSPDVRVQTTPWARALKSATLADGSADGEALWKRYRATAEGSSTS